MSNAIIRSFREAFPAVTRYSLDAQCIMVIMLPIAVERLTDMGSGPVKTGYCMNEAQRTAHFVAIILSEIRRKPALDDAAFQKIVSNDIVIPELVKNYGYFHMFGYDQVIRELSQKEPLLAL
ncbi:MAG: hypothetical protein FWG23_04765 [Eggerthellaceae bacterium]|nr:hypothetical protein [Eggerthellaceae bacterium]